MKIMEFTKVGTSQLTLIIIGTVIFFTVPLVMAIIWKVKKKEKISTILTGAATFLLFALILEKPIQNALVFPTLMGLPYHGAAQFLDANPVLWALVVGLFPGVFEETGRLVAYKTLLKNRKNRETSISHGIGHGGMEVILVVGITYVTYIVYALMINSGTFGALIEQAQAQGPDSVAQGYAIAAQLAAFSAGDLLLAIVERIFAVMYHIGASVLVFYACKDKKKFWLYPLAILIHTLIDGFGGLQLAGVLIVPAWVMELVVAVSGSLTFFGAYFLLYRKDNEDVGTVLSSSERSENA